jgi:hypothetical protein
MKIAILIGRVLLGMGFIIFGLNILHPFMTSPPPPEGSLAAQFVGVMVPSHWIALVAVTAIFNEVSPSRGVAALGPTSAMEWWRGPHSHPCIFEIVC